MEGNFWPRIAVLGAGAVGCYFGGMLARAGASVTLIGRPPHVGALSRNGLFFDGLHFQQQIAVSASTQVSAVRDAEIVLFCVKTLDTEEAAKSLAPHLAPGAAVISLQNGVDNVERIRSTAKIDARSRRLCGCRHDRAGAREAFRARRSHPRGSARAR